MNETCSKTKKISKAGQKNDDNEPCQTMSVRLKASEMAKLRSVADKTGRTITDIVKAGSGLGSTTTDQAYRKGFKEGFDEGFQEARDKYAVYAMCAKCLNGIAITDDEMRDEAGLLYSNEYTCYHEDCGVPKERTGDELRRFKKEERSGISSH